MISGQSDKPEPPPGTNFARVHTLPSAATAPLAPGAADEGEGWQWRIDLKWIFAIPFTFFLILSLALFTLFRLTEEQQAEGIIAAMNAPIVAQPQFRNDLSVGAPELYKFLDSSGFAVSVYQNPDQLQNRIGTIPDNLAAANLPPAAAGSGLGGSGSAYRAALGIYSSPMRFLSSGVHIIAGKILAVMIVLLLVTGIPLVIFSRRLGKAVSIGASLAVASWLPYMFLTLVSRGLDGWVTDGGVQAQTGQQRLLKDALRPFFDGVFAEASRVYRYFSVGALLFLAVAAIAYLILKLRPGGYPDRRRA
ncbi:MAG: hypothetical protein ACYDGX_08680 [Thermoleophilia bacterium]